MPPLDYLTKTENSLDFGDYVTKINVFISIGTSRINAGTSGIITPQASRPDVRNIQTLVIAAVGFIVSNGDSLSPDGNGSIPLSYNGQLFVDDANFVDEDVFTN